jgi:hypothetical protein
MRTDNQHSNLKLLRKEKIKSENAVIAAILSGNMITPITKVPSSELDEQHIANADATARQAIDMYRRAAILLDRWPSEFTDSQMDTVTLEQADARQDVKPAPAPEPVGIKLDVSEGDLHIIAALITGGMLPRFPASRVREIMARRAKKDLRPTCQVVADALNLYSFVVDTLRDVGLPPPMLYNSESDL